MLLCAESIGVFLGSYRALPALRQVQQGAVIFIFSKKGRLDRVGLGWMDVCACVGAGAGGAVRVCAFQPA